MHIDNVPHIIAACCVLHIVNSNMKASMNNGYRKLLWISLIVSQHYHQEVGVNKFEQY